jgi:hypothetical protein
MNNARTKYSTHKSNAKRRGIEFDLTFEQWFDIWEKSNKWNERGRGADKYCMCRVGDTGSYSVNNVFIGQGKHNVSDGNIGKIDSEETRRRKSQAAKGRPHDYAKGVNNVMHRPEVKSKLSEAISGSKHYRAKAVQTPFGMFLSGIEASKALNIPKPTVYWKCKYQKDGWSFLAIA